MSMFSMFVPSPPSGTPVNTVYREKQAFGPFGKLAGDETATDEESGFSEVLWLEVAEDAPVEFRTLLAFCSGIVKVVGTQDGFPIAPDSPVILSLTPLPRPEMAELDRICRAAHIETPTQILYHGVSPDSLMPLIERSFQFVKTRDDQGNIEEVTVENEEILEVFLQGDLEIYLSEVASGAGGPLGEVSDKNLSEGHFAFGIEMRTTDPIRHSLPDPFPRENTLDPAVLFQTLANTQLSDETDAIPPAETNNSWLDVATTNRVLITLRDEWNAILASGENMHVEGPSSGQNVDPVPLTDKQGGTIVAPDGWGQYSCQIGGSPPRKLSPLVSDQGASGSLTINASAPAHRVIGSVRPEDWFHPEDPSNVALPDVLTEFWKSRVGEEVEDPGYFKLPRYTEDNLVEPLIDGFSTFSNLVKDMRRIDDPDHFMLISGWATYHDFDLIPSDSSSSLAELLTVAFPSSGDTPAEAGEGVLALLWDQVWGLYSETNQKTSNFINSNFYPIGQTARLESSPHHTLHGSHHSKFEVVRNSKGTFAHLGGTDINPNRLDGPDHRSTNSRYHDVQCRIQGPAAADVTKAFVDRYINGANPEYPAPPFDVTPTTNSPSEATHMVQIARTYAARAQDYTPDGIRTIWATIRQAIRRARKYIYIEDQYLVHDEFRDELLNALNRIDYLIIVIDGENSDLSISISGDARKEDVARARYLFLDPLRDAHPQELHVFSLRNHGSEYTVHSKVLIIDDIFVSIGSANVNRRSMTHDSELNAFVLDGRLEDGGRKFARDLRISLWAEHLGWHRSPGIAKARLTNVDHAIEWLTTRRPSSARLNPYNLNKGAGTSYPPGWDSTLDPDGSTPP